MIDWIKLNLKNKPKITIHDLFIEPYPHRHRYLHPPTRIILSSFSYTAPPWNCDRARNEGTPGDVIVWKSFYINTGLRRLTPFSIQHSSGRDWPRVQRARESKIDRKREREATTGGWPSRVELSCSGIFMSAECAGFEPIYTSFCSSMVPVYTTVCHAPTCAPPSPNTRTRRRVEGQDYRKWGCSVYSAAFARLCDKYEEATRVRGSRNFRDPIFRVGRLVVVGRGTGQLAGSKGMGYGLFT